VPILEPAELSDCPLRETGTVWLSCGVRAAANKPATKNARSEITMRFHRRKLASLFAFMGIRYHRGGSELFVRISLPSLRGHRENSRLPPHVEERQGRGKRGLAHAARHCRHCSPAFCMSIQLDVSYYDIVARILNIYRNAYQQASRRSDRRFSSHTCAPAPFLVVARRARS
jgi:hypothetical protein